MKTMFCEPKNMMIRERTVASLYVPGEAMLIKNKEGVRWVGQA
jgi:hypothetical protein